MENNTGNLTSELILVQREKYINYSIFCIHRKIVHILK